MISLTIFRDQNSWFCCRNKKNVVVSLYSYTDILRILCRLQQTIKTIRVFNSFCKGYVQVSYVSMVWYAKNTFKTGCTLRNSSSSTLLLWQATNCRFIMITNPVRTLPDKYTRLILYNHVCYIYYLHNITGFKQKKPSSHRFQAIIHSFINVFATIWKKL